VLRGANDLVNKIGWHLWVAIFLFSLLSANVAFGLDGEAILRALRDTNTDTRRRALKIAAHESVSITEPTNKRTQPTAFRARRG
jgi:hypothetical protein